MPTLAVAALSFLTSTISSGLDLDVGSACEVNIVSLRRLLELEGLTGPLSFDVAQEAGKERDRSFSGLGIESEAGCRDAFAVRWLFHLGSVLRCVQVDCPCRKSAEREIPNRFAIKRYPSPELSRASSIADRSA